MRPILLLLSLFTTISAHASAPALNVSISRTPLYQGSQYAIFASDPSPDSSSPLTVTATLDGSSVNLLHPNEGLWIFAGKPLHTIRSHMLVLSIFENGELSGTQAFAFDVVPNETSSDYPKFSSVSPQVGVDTGGTSILVKGSNFVHGAKVLIGGIEAATSFVDSETLLAVTPNFNTLSGQQPLEVQLPPLPGSTESRNVIAENAFYVADSFSAPSTAPVAIISNPNQSVVLGSSVELDGSLSYNNGGNSFAYEWEILVAPKNSLHLVGEALDGSPEPTFLPDVPGLFVVRLVVRETGVPEPKASHPQLAVIRVQPTFFAGVKRHFLNGKTSVLPFVQWGEL